MSPPKVHLRITRRGSEVPACNTRTAQRMTPDPSEVTCLTCIKTIAMADAELRQSQQPKRNRLFPRGNTRRSNQ